MHAQNVEKIGDQVQHNQSTSLETVNLAASAEPDDLDGDNSADVTEPTLAKRWKLKDHQGNSIAERNFNVNLLFDQAAHLFWVTRISFIHLTL